MYIFYDDKLADEIIKSDYKFVNEVYINNKKLIGPFGRVNIFIGANNSGKSRFMRGVLKTPKILGVIPSKHEEAFELILTNFKKLLDIIPNNFFMRITFGSPSGYNSFGINLLSNKTLTDYLDINVAGSESEFSKQTLIDFYSKIKLPLFYEKNIDYNRDILIEERMKLNFFKGFFSHIDTYHNEFLRSYANSKINLSNDYFNVINIFQQPLDNLINSINSFIPLSVQISNPDNRIYVPVLRSANSLLNSGGHLEADILTQSHSLNYGIPHLKTTPLMQIQSGDNLYEEIKRLTNGDYNARKNFENFENFLSENFYQGKRIDIVAKDQRGDPGKNIVVNIGNREHSEHPIHQLGDGVQAIIIIMFSMFNATKGSWIFIEEPEINLHPGFQRIFMDTILNNKFLKEKELTIFLTTHSNHLLDIAYEVEKDISIFSFDKTIKSDKIVLEVKNIKRNDTEILSKLGVTNGSVFMSNSSIWVEGVSDRLYIRAFLKAFYSHNKTETQFKEDLHFTFFEYAGSNLAHYIFDDLGDEEQEDLDKIKGQYLSNKIFLLADKDKGKDKKHNNFLSQENRNFTYEILEVKEIENLLSPIQIKNIFGNIIKRGLNKENLNKLVFNREDYKNKYLGEYLMTLFENNDVCNLKLSASSGTLESTYKTKVAAELYKIIKWDDMTDEAKKLAEKIYMFIKNANQDHFLS